MTISTDIYTNKSIVIRELTGKDTLSIQNIWKECFTTDMDYINTFIENCFPYSTSWGLFTNNSSNAVAMLSMLPSHSTIKDSQGKSKIISGIYVYGVATLNSHRKKGYSQLLMKEVISYAQKNYLDYIILKPAEESLYNFYKKQSFKNTLTCHQFEVEIPSLNNRKEIPQNTPFKTIPNNQNNHTQNRESLVDTNFMWPNNILQYSLLEIRSRGGITRYYPSGINSKDNQLNKEIYGAPLFYSAYPNEEKASTIKVVDHNILTNGQLNSVINDITSQFNYTNKISFEFPITANLEQLGSYAKSSKIINNGLIKILSADYSIKNKLLKLHLTLSME